MQVFDRLIACGDWRHDVLPRKPCCIKIELTKYPLISDSTSTLEFYEESSINILVTIPSWASWEKLFKIFFWELTWYFIIYQTWYDSSKIKKGGNHLYYSEGKNFIIFIVIFEIYNLSSEKTIENRMLSQEIPKIGKIEIYERFMSLRLLWNFGPQ